MYELFGKRIIDFTLSLIIIVLLFPIGLIVALLIRLDSPGPIFYTQERLGFHGKRFLLYKFRSMKINRERKENQVYKNHPDITLLGNFLRRYKLDETPQLVNVLKGDMSLIGPRPCLPSLEERFDTNGKLRLTVRPGLSGWAQVNGNIYNSWEKRWEYDAFYATRLNFALDVKIFLKTIGVIFLGEEKR